MTRPTTTAPQSERRGPPEDEGKPLATLDRGPNCQLRVRGKMFKGAAFVDVRVWEKNDRGDWWPTRGKGVTLKPRELRELASALATAADNFERRQGQGGDRG